MIEAVQGYDPKTAAGILSSLVLRLEQVADSRLPEATELERQILAELHRTLNLDPKDESFEAVERLTDALDEEAERIAGIQPDPTITEKLSRDGLLPSDVFKIRFYAGLEKHHGSHWAIDRRLAEITIRHPHREQSFSSEATNSGISLFARFFTHRFPARSFWLLVTGVRSGSVLEIGEVFRVYPRDVNLANCETLTDVLEEFANRFGVEIELNGQRRKFFMEVKAGIIPINDEIGLPNDLTALVVIAGLNLTNNNDKEETMHLVFAINLTSYFRSVEAKHGWDKSILNELK